MKTYKDNKKWLWLLSVLYPTVAIPGLWMHYLTENTLWLLYPFVITYIFTPFLDTYFGEDNSNHPDEVQSDLEKIPYYKILTYIAVPIHIFVFFISAFYIGLIPLSLLEILLISASAGLVSGIAINTGHELGHKKTKIERSLAKIVLSIPAYGHFTIEHNRGHHSNVSTPEDAASAKMGENIYEFALREMPESFKNAISIEKKRLYRLGKSFWCFDNELMQSFSLTLIFQVGLLISFGLVMVPFLLVHNLFAWWQLTSANYIEHYGLLREKLSNGRYELCKPYHSWNSNYLVGNLHLFNLQRHSDHHANPGRRYQVLRNFDDLPSLPSGYLGCYLLAYFPWLWFRIMDKKLLSLRHINGDFNKINIHPKKKNKLIRKYA